MNSFLGQIHVTMCVDYVYNLPCSFLKLKNVCDVNVEREKGLKRLKEHLEQRNKKISDSLNHVNIDANVKFKVLRDKLQESNKQLEDERAYTIDIFKRLESS